MSGHKRSSPSAHLSSSSSTSAAAVASQQRKMFKTLAATKSVPHNGVESSRPKYTTLTAMDAIFQDSVSVSAVVEKPPSSSTSKSSKVKSGKNSATTALASLPTEPWNKLNKSLKAKYLHQFAHKYVDEKNDTNPNLLPALEQFFNQSLDKGKLVKPKEVVFDKNTQEITDIPGLQYQTLTQSFVLRNVDPKRVSTLKSLTPIRRVVS